MMPTRYFVFKELTYDTINRIKRGTFTDALIEMKENSKIHHRLLFCSGMKPYSSEILCKDSPEVQASIVKHKITCNPYCNGNSFMELEVRIEGSLKK